VKTTALTTLHNLAVLPHLTIPTNLVERRNQILPQRLHLHANTRIGHLRKNSRTFTKRLNFMWFLNLAFFITSFLILIFIIPALLTSPSLFSYPYSYPLHFPSFSCAIIHCSPSHLLFLPLLILFFPHLHLSLLSFPTLSPHYPSLLHTH
jgi:hypothetical protein